MFLGGVASLVRASPSAGAGYKRHWGRMWVGYGGPRATVICPRNESDKLEHRDVLDAKIDMSVTDTAIPRSEMLVSRCGSRIQTIY